MAVQETKIDDSVSTAELFPSELGFSVLQSDRNLGGGGVLLAIRQNLNPMSCLALAQGESVWAKVHLDGQVHYFRSIYRPPQQSSNELLHYLFLQSWHAFSRNLWILEYYPVTGESQTYALSTKRAIDQMQIIIVRCRSPALLANY